MSVDIKKTFDNVDDGIANMIAAANYDYCDGDRFNDDMVEEFKKGWKITKGSKYIKICTRNGGSSWGFVVNTDDDKKFKKGDLLKCAGYSAPARNGRRGNVLEGGFSINWTGPMYLVGPAGYSIKSTKTGVFG
jgi:hypothetical protein